MPAKAIALFNHKGGVSKTTTTFNLGWMLAEMGRRTIIVDTDSQCNLTGMALGYQGPEDLERFYREHPSRNIFAALSPAFEARPEYIEGVDCLPVSNREGLFLLPGHIGISEYEVTLGIAQELSGSVQTLQNLPGSIRHLLNATSERMDAEYVLVDMSPGLGAINQNLVTTADFILVPASPDFFSVMAMDSLARVLPRWQAWAQRAAQIDLLRSAVYPFPEPEARFLGTIIQRYRPRSGNAAQAFQRWIDRMAERVDENLVPAMADAGMVLPEDRYQQAGLARGHCLAEIPDFNSLIAKSQDFQTPVFALSREQIGGGGAVQENQTESRDQFHATFSDIAARVLSLTNAGA